MNFHAKPREEGRTRNRPENISPRSWFRRTRKLETQYAARLRKIAQHVAEIIRAFPEGTAEASGKIGSALGRYAMALEPWAQAVGARMVAEVASRDQQAWRAVSAEMGNRIRQEIATAPTGERMRQLMSEQVKYITSLPIEAAQRVHKVTLEGIATGSRASAIAEEVMRTGEVIKSRANLIARTEVGRTSTTLTQARAEHVGSTGYIWRTAGDGDVRSSHKKMNGKFVAWDDPPTLDGLTGHAGALPNCRCYPEPVIPDTD